MWYSNDTDYVETRLTGSVLLIRIDFVPHTGLEIKGTTSKIIYVFVIACRVVFCRRRNMVTFIHEAEYFSLIRSSRKAIWLYPLLIEFSSSVRTGTKTFSDSQIVLRKSGNEGIRCCNKHIEGSYHFSSKVVPCSEDGLEYKSNSDLVADYLAWPKWWTRFQIVTIYQACRESGRLIQISLQGVWGKISLFYQFELIWFFKFIWDQLVTLLLPSCSN